MITLESIQSHVFHVSNKTNGWFVVVADSRGALCWSEGIYVNPRQARAPRWLCSVSMKVCWRNTPISACPQGLKPISIDEPDPAGYWFAVILAAATKAFQRCTSALTRLPRVSPSDMIICVP